MLKQVVLTILSPWCRVLAHGKSQNALNHSRIIIWVVLGPKMGPKWVKNAFFQK